MQPSAEPDSGALYGKVWRHAKVSACRYGSAVAGFPDLSSLESLEVLTRVKWH